MNFILDAIIIIICIMIIVTSTKKGFIKSIMGLGSNIAAIFVGAAFTPVIAPIVSEKYILKPIAEGIRDTLESLVKNPSGGFDIDKALSEIPVEFNEILSRYGADIDKIKNSFSGINNGTQESIDELAEMITAPVANTISSVLTFLLLFIATIIVLSIITFILDMIFKFPILNTANGALGFLFGVICALLTAWILSVSISYFVGAMNSVYPQLFDKNLVENSMVLDFFVKYNPIKVIGNMFA